MGADITFYCGNREFYFRDSYNPTNLAWVINMSYWKCPNSLKAHKRFFEKLATITDYEIAKYVRKLHEDKESNIVPNVAGWTKGFTLKREKIRENLRFIKEADRVEWSV